MHLRTFLIAKERVSICVIGRYDDAGCRMTEGERFVGSFPRKADFHDRSKRRSYELTRRVAARLIDDPGLVANGRVYLERWIRPDAGQSPYYALWTELLDRDIRQVVSQLLEDSPRGELLRDTQPVFVVLAAQERAGLDRGAGQEGHGADLPA